MKWKDKKVLVTGASGFIGSHLVERLKEFNANIIEIDKSEGIDITDWEELKEFKDIETIYHLAAITYVPYSFKNPKETYETNILGTLNILELAKINKAKLIFPSSYVYGSPKYLPINEKHPLNPNNPYTGSKLIAEKLCRDYSKNFNIPVVIFRPFNIYGPNQNENFLIPKIIKQINEEGKIELKDPEPKRDFLYVRDLIDAYISATEYNGSRFEIFNLGFGKSYSVGEIVSKIISLYGKKINVEYSSEKRKNEVMDCFADISKAKKLLSWEPKINIEEGLIKVLADAKL